MIPKVNKPMKLTLVSTAKTPEEGTGSGLSGGMGGGLDFERDSKSQPDQTKKETGSDSDTPKQESQPSNPTVQAKSIGMSKLFQDFFSKKKKAQVTSNSNPSQQYSQNTDSTPARGLLLNKKA